MRTALDAGDARRAIRVLNEELGVESEKQIPKPLAGDNALLVLDRGSIQQSVLQFDGSKKDFEAADKVIDMLDLSRNAADSIAKYIYSDSAGRYQAPPYEKLFINTLNMVNYLELGDLGGARVESRRLSVIQKFYRDSLKLPNSPVLGIGSLLAGFACEKNDEVDEALRYYDEAMRFVGTEPIKQAAVDLLSRGSYASPALRELAEQAGTTQPSADEGDVFILVGQCRVSSKVAQRLPIGLALTYAAGAISPNDRARATELEA